MPAIRDYASNYTTSTSGTTIVIPVPAWETDDLLLAILVADTNSGAYTWSCAGWQQLFDQVNTSALTVLYRIAASEPADYTFTRTGTETFNGRIVSIRDVNTAYPFGDPATYVTANQAAAAKYQLPQVTTIVPNSLIIYAVSNAAVGCPSIIEGPVSLLCGEDGTAESGGVGWGFMPSIGASPNNVTCSNYGTGAGKKAAIQIAPPAGGAIVIPAYCAADASIYINPIHGVTAYNGDTALAATADTNWSTTIAGKTAGDATVAAAQDTGINPYHATGRLTSVASTKNWAGAELVILDANRPNVSGKNVLVHCGPSTPGQIQRLAPASGGFGIAFGMRSGANTNYRVWQVHGAGTPWGYSRDVPFVIHPDNTSGRIDNVGTLDQTLVKAFGFWICSTGVSTATAWDFYSLWALGTVTVCGGIEAEPIDIPGVVRAAGLGHERKSVIQQGAGQALILGPIQIGDGGTHPTYLDLNATAIEFPKLYNKATKEVNYCSVENMAGITYYAGASDTIKHRNSVISSSSPFFWTFDTNSSASATYDFGGLQIIGAGLVTLKTTIPLVGVSFSACVQIDASGCTLTDCVVASPKSGVDAALLISETTTLQDCAFSTLVATDHFIEIAAAGTYPLVGCTYSGATYDINVTATSGTVTVNISGGGETPTYTSAGATVVINNPKTLTLTGLIADSEVRIYTHGTQTLMVKAG